MATVNKEMMMELLKNKLGEDIDLSVITDEDIQSLIVIDQNVDEEDIVDEDLDDEVQDNANDVGGYDYEDLNIDDLDESQMTESERMLYRALKKMNETNRRDKLNALIVSSDIDDSYKNMLKEMVSLGAPKEKIEQLISKTIEETNKTKRNLGSGTRMFSKKQTKLTKDIAKPKAKIGSKAWGESL